MSTDTPLVALDTNILLRAMVEDDPVQTAVAKGCIERADGGEFRLLVTTVVLCELEWVLDHTYRFTRREIADAMGRLESAKAIEFEDQGAFTRALSAYRDGKGDLSDYLVREAAVRAGCSTVLTFEKALVREEGFSAP